jgi:hypothetical protein
MGGDMLIVCFRLFFAFFIIFSNIIYGYDVELKFKFNDESIEVIRADKRVFTRLKTIDNMIVDIGGFEAASAAIIPLIVGSNSFKAIVKILNSALYMYDENPDLKRDEDDFKGLVRRLIETNWKNMPMAFLLEVMKTVHYIDAAAIERDLIQIIIESINNNANQMPHAVLSDLIQFACEQGMINIFDAAVKLGCHSDYIENYIVDASFLDLNSKVRALFIKHLGFYSYKRLICIREETYLASEGEILNLHKMGLEVFGSQWKRFSDNKLSFVNSKIVYLGETQETKYKLTLEEILAEAHPTQARLELGLEMALAIDDAETIEKLLNKKVAEAVRNERIFEALNGGKVLSVPQEPEQPVQSNRKPKKRRVCSIQ